MRFSRFLFAPASIGAAVLLLCNPPAQATEPAAASADFETRFASPPPESRIIKIIHGWPDKPSSQDDLIRHLQHQGFGGVVCNVSFDKYLESPEKWEAFDRAVRVAKASGMALWLYDERGYPSGNAGGLVLREHPEWEARGLLVADGEFEAGPVDLAVPPGKLRLASAFPIQNRQINVTNRVDLAGEMHEGKLRWTAPSGRWHVMLITEDRLYEGTHADGNLFEKTPYVNLLQPEPTERFVSVTHQQYAEHLGTNLGQTFEATFTDEPSLMSCYLKPMPWRPLPWAPNLPIEFKRRRGYPLDEQVIPALIGDAGSNGMRARYDFWLTVGELVSENYFGHIQARCRQWSIPSGGHLLMEESLVAHVPLYGNFFQCARRLDAPSLDCLTSIPAEVPWYVARLLASAAELDDRRIVMSETSDHGQVWRGPGDKRPIRVVTEPEIRGTCNRLIVSGVNAITSYYSFKDLPDTALRRLNEWVGRCCTSLLGGHQVADIALLYPVESIWPKFRPARHWANDSPEATAVENMWRAAAESLFASQRDFTVVDSRTLAEAKVKDGMLLHGKLQWRVIVLPATDTLPLAAWENLGRFVQTGGVLIALGNTPLNTETDFPSTRARAIGRMIFGAANAGPLVASHEHDGAGVFLPVGSESLLPVVLDGMLERGVTVHALRSPVRSTRRGIDGSEVFFLINDSGKPWRGEVSVSATGAGELWNPAEKAVAQTNLGQRVKLDLQPYGGVILRYPGARVPQRHVIQSGSLPNLRLRPLPTITPERSQGEFVRAEARIDKDRSEPSHPVWQASATLTKGGVDTFMFLRFIFPEPINLERADCLVLDAWVPPGQGTGTQLLAIVQEKEGGDFIASTGCGLGVAGHQRIYVPLNRLQLAGWSPDVDGELDLRRVSEVRIGWGGYLGAEGERIGFSVSLPQAGFTPAMGTP